MRHFFPQCKSSQLRVRYGVTEGANCSAGLFCVTDVIEGLCAKAYEQDESVVVAGNDADEPL